jgi:prepilin signal peptidase PulO-like enzyme (type II secretory pathway)
MGRRSPLPFGVFMALGGILALFVGPELWGFYLDLVSGA